MINTNTFSKPLSKAQAEYAIQRLTDIKNMRLKKVIEALVKPTEPIKLSEAEMYTAIKTGKVKIRPLEDIGHSSYWTRALIFPQYETKVKIHKAEVVKFEESCNKLKQPIEKSFRLAVDTIMLGDAAAALDTIEKFSQGK